jgi:glucose-6-phosphate 1-dehydrogenase
MKDATFIIFGATGDLTRRKIIPAIYKLVKNKKLRSFRIIGCARSKKNIQTILSQSKKFARDVQASRWRKIVKNSVYQVLDFYKEEDYTQLAVLLGKQQRIFYLATAPEHFHIISKYLAKYKLARKTDNVVYEKPFGHDLYSAKKINKCISTVFNEKQIYRIDHYLGKELVGDITLMRFTNRILEPLWNSKHIAQIQIVMTEDLLVGKRGGFYDKYGVLKDVVQNHALQLLALTAMEAPKMLSGEYIRSEKARVLKRTQVTAALVGQYHGYKSEPGVTKNSTTETFAALQLKINNSRWRGVPFYILAGKALVKKQTSIHIKFKEVHCLLAKSCPSDSNYFTIRIQPDNGFSLELNSKMPGKKQAIIPVNMDFCEKCRFGPNTPEAYETLLEDVLCGDQSVFVRKDEIEYAWKIIDRVRKGKIYSYKKGTGGPPALDAWNKKNGVLWKEVSK